jgi:putative Mg2+ transporter-C (MgtC) family protein
MAEIALRILASFLAGFIVGWERETHGRPAGLRTTILACVASAVAMMVSEILFAQTAAANPTASWRPDPARLGAGILTGIGFLGAGTILRHENMIRGVTTAATLWFVTVLGLAFGSGQFTLGGIGVLTALLTLFVLPRLEKWIQSDWYSTLTVTTIIDALTEAELKSRLQSLGLIVQVMHFDYDLNKKQKTITCDVKLKRPQAFELSALVMKELTLQPGIVQVKWT